MPKLGQHCTDEQKAKLSASRIGKTMSPEARKKDSLALMGNTNMLGYHHSAETRAKLSAIVTGRVVSPETRAKLSSALKGRSFSPEHRAKLKKPKSLEARANMSASHKGVPLSIEHRAKLSAVRWKGGRLFSGRREQAKRRNLGFVFLNQPFVGCEGHHIDSEQIIFMPKALHRSVFHRQTDGRGMAKMNALAYNFLFKQEVEAAIAAKERL